jgi:hypothetical protein
MGWINTLLVSGITAAAVPAKPCNDTVINSASYDAHETARSDAQKSVTRQHAQIADEIKRRQIALVTRYVMTVRGR